MANSKVGPDQEFEEIDLNVRTFEHKLFVKNFRSPITEYDLIFNVDKI